MSTHGGALEPPGRIDRLIARIVALFTGSATDENTVPTSGAATKHLQLRYFEDVLPVELMRINRRRAALRELREKDWREGGGHERRQAGAPERRKSGTRGRETGEKERRVATPDRRKTRGDVQPLSAPKIEGQHRRPSPDPDKLFNDPFGNKLRRTDDPIDPNKPDQRKLRPRPVPNDTTGLALSGGGIRSAAVCLGALQALHRAQQIDRIDYLSTVSGGGYIGTCFSTGMLQAFPPNLPQPGDAFPFGDDVADNAAIGHLRNFSNYLLPRGRSGLRNYAEVIAIILRGLLANAAQVLAALLFAALVTMNAFPNRDELTRGSFLGQWLDHAAGSIARLMSWPVWPINNWIGAAPFSLTLKLALALGAVLMIWAMLRTFPRLDRIAGDTRGFFLGTARALIIALAVVAFLDAQPLAISWFIDLQTSPPTQGFQDWVKSIVPVLVAFSGAVSAVSSALGHFLKKSEHTSRWSTYILRAATQGLLLVAAFALPVALWLSYLYLCAWGIAPASDKPPASLAVAGWSIAIPVVYATLLAPLIVIYMILRPNGYSLHRFYRDRLSRAFVFFVAPGESEPTPLDQLKLSSLRDSIGPYHIFNTAMNVQGSAAANKRGRNADFFMFTPDFIGSDLTMYGPTVESIAATPDMETIDARLDLATAMAISGAAVSANMGSNTVRLLSPTLALLNVRLGYWLRNPRDLARGRGAGERARRGTLDKCYLLLEMLNLLDENSRQVYLTDGGHIENLGVYELLKRGCRTIVVIDAEADPTMSFGSLLTLERYARIDLGVRISLPWEQIAAGMRRRDAHDLCQHGPHCAVGRIAYENGATGVLIYFKSSITGDEKDYILDYRKRFPDFPHETTGDQFFSEEQFEAYRALGFHMVDGFFQGRDKVAHLRDPGTGFDAAEIATLRRDLALQSP